MASLRREKCFTQQEVADRLDVSNRTVSAWEKDKAMPDILLLPAIAELYGVTVDEILYGARKSGESERAFSHTTAKSILLRKLSRFTLQSYILLGVSIIGQLFIFLGWYNDTFTYTEKGEFNWWKLIAYLGLVTAVVAVVVLIALWKSCESSVDDSLKESSEFYQALFKRVAIHFYVAEVLTFALGLFDVILCNYWPVQLMCSVYLLLPAIGFIVVALLHNAKLKSVPESAIRIRRSRNLMLYFVVVGGLFAVASFLSSRSWYFGYLKAQAALVFVCSILSLALWLIGILLAEYQLCKSFKEDLHLSLKASANMSVCLYVLSALYCLFGGLSLIRGEWIAEYIAHTVLLFAFSLTSLLLGSLLHRRNLLRWSSEMQDVVKQNGKLYLKIFLWGLIPFGAACLIASINMVLATITDILWRELAFGFFNGCVVLVMLDVVVCFVLCIVLRKRTSVKK